MSIYCALINLARVTARRERMMEEMTRAGFDRAGISVEIVDAVDASAMPVEALLALNRREGPWGLVHDQNMACTMSHRKVWMQFLARSEPYCLVLEDDVFLSPDLPAWLSDMAWWPQGADVVKLERWRSKTLRVVLDNRGTHHRGRAVRPMLTRHSGTAGYIMTRAAAQRLVDAAPYDLGTDHLMFNRNASRLARGMAIHQVTPALVEQGNEPPATDMRRTSRPRPRGMPLLRQKLRRAWREIAYPLSTWAALILGRARAERIPYAATVAPT